MNKFYNLFNNVYYLFIAGNVIDGTRKSETAIEDMFIRKFLNGTWHNLFVSEVGKLSVNHQRNELSLVSPINCGILLNAFVFFHLLLQIIIKRQYNIIRVAGIVQRKIAARKMYFLLGYSEELLSYWLKCPIKLELQTVPDKKDVVYKWV